MKTSIASGLAGALAVTAVNLAGRRFLPEAPHLDTLGMRLAARAFPDCPKIKSSKPILFAASLAGDLVGNSLFYGLVGLGKPRWIFLRGGLLGLVAGAGAVWAPEYLGLGKDTTHRTTKTTLLTIAWYAIGGCVAALSHGFLKRRR